MYLTQILVSGLDIEEADGLRQILGHVQARVEAEAEDGVHDGARVLQRERQAVGQLLEGADGHGGVGGLQAADVGLHDLAAVLGRVPHVLEEQVVGLGGDSIGIL